MRKVAQVFAEHGFVGRDISNFAINLFKAGTGSDAEEITEEVRFVVVVGSGGGVVVVVMVMVVVACVLFF